MHHISHCNNFAKIALWCDLENFLSINQLSWLHTIIRLFITKRAQAQMCLLYEFIQWWSLKICREIEGSSIQFSFIINDSWPSISDMFGLDQYICWGKKFRKQNTLLVFLKAPQNWCNGIHYDLSQKIHWTIQTMMTQYLNNNRKVD